MKAIVIDQYGDKEELKEKELEAEVKGQGNFEIQLDFIPVEKEVKKGQVVITGSLGDNYPPELLVGEIKELKQKDVKPFQIAEIEPFFERNSEYLFIIKDY